MALGNPKVDLFAPKHKEPSRLLLQTEHAKNQMHATWGQSTRAFQPALGRTLETNFALSSTQRSFPSKPMKTDHENTRTRLTRLPAPCQALQ